MFTLMCACGGSEGAARQATLRRLETEPTAENLHRLRGHARDPDRDVRAAVLHTLVASHDSDASRLVGEGLATAVRLALERGDARFVGSLARLLAEDSDPTVRLGAAEALARLGGLEAHDALIGALADPVDRVRRAAVEGLGSMGVDAAREPLTRLLSEDPAWEVRADAARALAALADPEVVPALQSAQGDPNEFVRAAASRALQARAGAGQIGQSRPAGGESASE
jgi:HEAT repeat protein